MRLWFDVQALQGPFYERGIARYVRGLASSLIEEGADVAGFGLNPSQPRPNAVHGEIDRSPLTQYSTAANLRAVAAHDDLVYLCGSAFEGYAPLQNLWPNYLVIPDVPAAAVVYDTIPLRRRGEFQATHERRRFYAARRHLLERADCYLAISQSTARELVEDVEIGESPVHVVGCGVDARFQPADDPGQAFALAVSVLPALRQPFLFYVGGFQPQKNVEGLITAFSLLTSEVRDAVQLVIGGSVTPTQTAQWQALADGLGVGNDVLFTGLVDDDTLLALYQTARLAVVPSKHEGFGLPAAEAIACATPAITSNTSSLPEVVGWEPATFDPDDPSAIAALIERTLTDRAYDTALRAACAKAVSWHQWSSVAERTLAAVSGISGYGRRAPIRPRVACVVDDVAGDALHGLDIELRTRFPGASIDLFADADRVASGRFPRRSFGRTASPALYDVVVDPGDGCPSTSDLGDLIERRLASVGLAIP